jgi:acetyl-CoA/propionyl-CoA carboxylase biotin carboxyl carrier protein
MVTGLDLVAWQLRLAAGERLTLSPDDAVHRGHAVQARVYAEDPARQFLPASGTAALVRWPEAADVRVDAAVGAGGTGARPGAGTRGQGVLAYGKGVGGQDAGGRPGDPGLGQRVPAEYDPLLAKVICRAPTRGQALARLDRALAESVVLGLPTNIAFLRRLIGTPEVKRGPVDIAYVEAHPELAREEPPPAPVLAAVARASLGGPPPWRALPGWRAGASTRPVQIRWGDARLVADWSVPPAAVDLVSIRAPDGRPGWEAGWRGARWQLWLDAPAAAPIDPAALGGADAGFARHPGGPGGLAAGPVPSAPDHWFVEAPLPGKLAQFYAAEGQELAPGAPVAGLEAMKLQHALATPRAARVVRLLVTPGAFVRAGQPLAELAPPGGE